MDCFIGTRIFVLFCVLYSVRSQGEDQTITKLELVSVGETSVTVKWQFVGPDPVVGFYLHSRESGSGDDDRKEMSVAAKQHTFANLKPGTDYTFRPEVHTAEYSNFVGQLDVTTKKQEGGGGDGGGGNKGQEEKEGESDGMGAGTIAGIVVGVLIGVALIVVAFVLGFKCTKKKSEKKVEYRACDSQRYGAEEGDQRDPKDDQVQIQAEWKDIDISLGVPAKGEPQSKAPPEAAPHPDPKRRLDFNGAANQPASPADVELRQATVGVAGAPAGYRRSYADCDAAPLGPSKLENTNLREYVRSRYGSDIAEETSPAPRAPHPAARRGPGGASGRGGRNAPARGPSFRVPQPQAYGEAPRAYDPNAPTDKPPANYAAQRGSYDPNPQAKGQGKQRALPPQRNQPGAPPPHSPNRGPPPQSPNQGGGYAPPNQGYPSQAPNQGYPAQGRQGYTQPQNPNVPPPRGGQVYPRQGAPSYNSPARGPQPPAAAPRSQPRAPPAQPQMGYSQGGYGSQPSTPGAAPADPGPPPYSSVPQANPPNFQSRIANRYGMPDEESAI